MSTNRHFFITNLTTTQQWAKDPDLIVVSIPHQYAKKAKKAVPFLLENGINNCGIEHGIEFETFDAKEEGDDEFLNENGLTRQVISHDGTLYVRQDPEYGLGTSSLLVDSDGLLSGNIRFKHSDDHIKFEICLIGDLFAVADKWKRFAVRRVINKMNCHAPSDVDFYDQIERASDDELEQLFLQHEVELQQQFNGVPLYVIACQIMELAKQGAATEMDS